MAKNVKDNKENFFEDETEPIVKEQPFISNNKDSKYGEYYLKNVVYKYKDGINTTVIYNSKEHIYCERQMN